MGGELSPALYYCTAFAGGLFKPARTIRRGDSLAMRLLSTQQDAHYNYTYNNRSHNNVNDALRRGNYNNRNKYNNDNGDDDDDNNNNIYETSAGRNETSTD